jgi:tetratricopeptide (TPR) repeat protein
LWSVKSPLLLLARWSFVIVVSFTAAFLMMHFGRHSAWYKNRLYRLLLNGDADERLHAASILAQVGGEHQLLQALKCETPEVEEMAKRALEHLWFYAAGREAYQMMEKACQAVEKEELKEALRVLDQLIVCYPTYAEAWNRRASVLWQLGQYAKSKADCERTLALNPNHYGAWQGLGICYLQLGDVAEACRALRAATRIVPHDDATQRSLSKCEALLRTYPAIRQPARTSDVL